VIPSDLHFQEALNRATQYFASQGTPPDEAARQAFAWVAQAVQQQAGLLAYIDVFLTLALVSVSAVLLAFLLRPTKLGAGAPAGAH
jgi:DHA2 family multidrug resistance protein